MVELDESRRLKRRDLTFPVNIQVNILAPELRVEDSHEYVDLRIQKSSRCDNELTRIEATAVVDIEVLYLRSATERFWRSIITPTSNICGKSSPEHW